MSDLRTNNPPAAQTAPANAEVNLLELVIALGRHKGLLFKITVATTTTALAYALFATPTFTGIAVVMPPQSQQSSAVQMLSSLGGLASLAGAAGGIKDSDDMYVAFLQSRTLEDDLIRRFELKRRYKTPYMDWARAKLESRLKITSDAKSGLITISADDVDPVFAAKLANGAVDAFRNLLAHLAVTDAQRRRVFFEGQVKRTQAALVNADAQFRALSAKGGLPVADALAMSNVQTSAALRAQITGKEVALASLRQFETEQNQGARRIESEIAALRAQLSKLESGGTTLQPSNSDGQAAVAALGEVKAQQAMLQVFTQQLQLAQVDEARDGPLVQVVDPATPPEHKSKPKRALIVILGMLSGVALGVLAALARHVFQEAQKNPKASHALENLRASWGWRSSKK